MSLAIAGGRLITLLLVGQVVIAILMALVWWASERIHNASIVDVAWSAWFTLLALGYAAFSDGDPKHRALIASIVTLWSLRLTFYLFRRVAREHPHEDKRYAAMRGKWGEDAPRKMFAFFQQQGLANVLLSVPFAVVALDRAPQIAPIAIAGVVLFALALSGEATADWQLSRFKADASNRGRTCDVGLWRYSRHPNYFCEWLVWCGFYLVACGSPHGWLTFYCPAGMLYLLLKVTGVPMAEEQSLKSRGDEYRAYQQRTNEFFPWFPKSAAAPVRSSS
jgi:steroid 5-alpha reductase family enzyme